MFTLLRFAPTTEVNLVPTQMYVFVRKNLSDFLEELLKKLVNFFFTRVHRPLQSIFNTCSVIAPAIVSACIQISISLARNSLHQICHFCCLTLWAGLDVLVQKLGCVRVCQTRSLPWYLAAGRTYDSNMHPSDSIKPCKIWSRINSSIILRSNMARIANPVPFHSLLKWQ